jgi:outer membrane protein assembly factor BamB
VNPVTGATQGPNFSLLSDYIRDVTVGPDGTVYVAAGGKMNSAIAINPVTGRQQWRQRAEGDVQAVKVSNGYVFFGFHDGFTLNGVRSYTLRLLAADPDTGDIVAGFTPESCCYPGVLTIDADGTFLAVGGLYGRMGGRPVHGVSLHP